MAKISVDEEKCVGCGLCVNLCPDAFEMDDNNKSTVKKGAEKHLECAKEAAGSCPTQAIKVEE